MASGPVLVLLRKLLEEERGRGGKLGPGGEADDPDFRGIELPLRGMAAHEANGLERVVHRIDRRLVAIDPEPVAEHDRRDAVLREERHQIIALGPDPQNLVPAARRDDDRRARVRRIGRRKMDLDRGVVNIERVEELVRALAAGVVALRLMNAVVFEQRRIRRIKREHEAARQGGRRDKRPVRGRAVCGRFGGFLLRKAEGAQARRRRVSSRFMVGWFGASRAAPNGRPHQTQNSTVKSRSAYAGPRHPDRHTRVRIVAG